MIRWRFVLTRLIIVVAIVFLLSWGLGPLATYVTVRGIESVTGAKVDIARANVGLFPPRVQYVNVQVTDPRDGKDMRDSVRADSVELVIDGDALLHRRWVASSGVISGLQIGSARETSGRLESTAPVDKSDDSKSMLAQLLGAQADKLGDQAESLVTDLETLRRSKEIRARWEGEYAATVLRARQLESKIRTISERAKGIDNPLRDYVEIERTFAEARQAKDDLMAVRQSLDSLPEQLQLDLASLEEAKRIDIAKVDKYIPGDLSNASEFGIDIITDAVRDQILEIKSYLDNGRTLANYTVVAPESLRVRGVDHNLERVARPELMIRQCEVNGLMRSGGDVYAMTGIVENMTPTPERLAEPTRARFRLEGPEVLRVEYVRDRRNDANVDLLTLHWPEMEAKPMRLGNPAEAGLAINGGKRELWVQVRTEGSAIEGRLVSKQTGVQMDLNVDPKFNSAAGVVSMRDSLAAVDRIEIDANFAGTWKDLDLKLNTNLGQVMRRASQDAIDGQLRETKAMMTAKIEKAHADQTIALRQWLGSQATEARSLLASADKSIEEMSRKVLGEAGKAEAMLGSRLRSAIESKLR
ncbi:MAG: TIGR03545 family protein [Rubripirellula sp.]